jgi:hypothetical protein
MIFIYIAYFRHLALLGRVVCEEDGAAANIGEVRGGAVRDPSVEEVNAASSTFDALPYQTVRHGAGLQATSTPTSIRIVRLNPCSRNHPFECLDVSSNFLDSRNHPFECLDISSNFLDSRKLARLGNQTSRFKLADVASLASCSQGPQMLNRNLNVRTSSRRRH